jgi:hypothetical protein
MKFCHLQFIFQLYVVCLLKKIGYVMTFRVVFSSGLPFGTIVLEPFGDNGAIKCPCESQNRKRNGENNFTGDDGDQLGHPWLMTGIIGPLAPRAIHYPQW